MRVKRGVVSRRRHNKLADLTKGYRGTKSKLIRAAKEAVLHADAYSYHGRKLRKRNFRTLWITRLSEAVKNEGMSYSVFIYLLKKANVQLDRKILNDILVNDAKTFKHIVDSIKTN